MENKSIDEMIDAEVREEARLWAKAFAYAKARGRGFSGEESMLYAEIAWRYFRRMAIDFIVLKEATRQKREEAKWN
jgi:hypothetical protein